MWWWMVKYRKMFGSRRRQSNKLSLKKGDGELYVRIAHIVRSLATIFRRVCRSYFGIWGHLPFNRQIIMSTDSFDFIAASWFDVCKVLQTNSVSLFRSFSILHWNCFVEFSIFVGRCKQQQRQQHKKKKLWKKIMFNGSERSGDKLTRLYWMRTRKIGSKKSAEQETHSHTNNNITERTRQKAKNKIK